MYNVMIMDSDVANKKIYMYMYLIKIMGNICTYIVMEWLNLFESGIVHF